MAPTPTTPADPRRGLPRRVGVLGGGTAGFFTALALKRRFPAMEVTVVESSLVPIIGVGEATTTSMPPFLHDQLGIDVHELYRAVRPTWKLGIRFDWGLPGAYGFNYPFGEANAIDAWAFDGDLNDQSLLSLLMSAAKAPVVIGDDGEPVSLLPRVPFAYHLENRDFVGLLAKQAARLGVLHLDATVEAGVPRPDGGGLECLRVVGGAELRFDLYVDATGFRSLLLEQALGSPFRSYASSLYCDTAVVAEVPNGGVVQPYTLAQTMDAGWCWRIPMEREDHRGYVFSSAFLSPDRAEAEMRALNPGMGEARTVRFRSGRHEHFWKGNTVAIGNAYGFVEPLESTALHMVIVQIGYLLGFLEAAGDGEPGRAEANERVGRHWDYLRWFLSLHYRFNRKKDNAFWRACRSDVDTSGLAPLLSQLAAHGPWRHRETPGHVGSDPVLGYDGPMAILLGQHVPCPPPSPPVISREAWARRGREQKALVARALPVREALALLRERPELLTEFGAAPWSWLRRGDSLPHLGPSSFQRPAPPRPAAPPGPYDHLLDLI